MSEQHKSDQTDNSAKDTIIINWNSGGNLTNTAHIKEYLKYGSTASTLAESSTKIVIPHDGYLTQLIVKLDTNSSNNPAPGHNNTRIFTIRKNSTDTDLFVKISDNDHQGDKNANIPVKKFDLISLSHCVTNGVPNNAIGIASLVISKNKH